MKLRPDSRIVDLAVFAPIDTLNRHALVTYIKLVAAAAKRGRKMRIQSHELGKHAKTVRVALQELEEAKLIKIDYGVTEGGAVDRVIEVL